MKILETDRLNLRQLALEDAGFILELVNDSAWLRFIGDRGVRNLADAANYLTNGPLNSYARNGFGLYLVELKENAVPLGMCGLIKRETLPDVDLGIAFLPNFRGQGYAYEASAGVLAYARGSLGLKRLVAITDPENVSSIKLLERLGFQYEQLVRLAADDIQLKLFGRNLQIA